MFRRTALSAAAAALAVLAGLPAGAAHADEGPTSAGTDGPVVGTKTPRATGTPAGRTARTSRDAKRAAKRDAAADDTPLSVTIDELTPSTIPDKGPIQVSGTVTNHDDVTWSTINVYSFISETPMTTAAELDAAADTDPAAQVGSRITDVGSFSNIPELAPGEHASFSFTVAHKLLHVTAPGVYWFGVHALGEDPDGGRDTVADGRARTFLPYVPAASTGAVKTAVVIPLRRALLYTDDGKVDDLATWARTLSPGGRLRSLVDFGASSGSRRVTWVVDPALIDAVRRLAAGNPARSLEPNLQQGQEDGEPEASAGADPSDPPTEAPTDAGTPTATPQDDQDSPLDLDELDPVVQLAGEAAQTWLDRLGAAMRPEDQVLSLPYGDVDVAGAAVSDPALLQRAIARSGTTLPGYDVTTTPVVAAPSGFLSTAGLRAVAQSSTVLLSDAMFDARATGGEPAPPASFVEGHRVVVTSTGAASGGPGPDERQALAAMRQRFLAEAAVRFLDPSQPPLTMVVPYDWNPSGSGATFWSGLDPSWLDLTTVADVSSSAEAEAVDGTLLRYPAWQAGSELDGASFEAADGLIRAGAALQSLLTLNNLIGGGVADEALGSASYSARTRPIEARTAADRSRQWISDRLGQVSVSAPPAVTLSNSSGRFPATIVNGLDQPVTIALDADTDGRLSIAGPQRVEVAARGRATVLLTASTDENGVHQVRLMTTDKRGVPLGSATSLTVRSAQVSNVIWLFIGVGVALLFGAIGLRLIRRVRAARRTSTPAPAADDARSATDPGKQPAGAGSR